MRAPPQAPTRAPMVDLTTLLRGTVPAGTEWARFPGDAYLDHRYQNWILAEDMGDVLFVPDARVVLVHRERAEHIVRALGVYEQAPASAPPRPTRMRRPLPPTPVRPIAVETKGASWC